MVCLSACGKDEKVTGGSGLPAGWNASLESNIPSFTSWHVGTESS